MRRRTLAIGIIAIAALLAGTMYAGRGLFLRAQFGRMMYSVPPEIMDALCGMPLEDGEPLVNSNYMNDVVSLKRGPAMGPGCLIRETTTICYAGCSTGVVERCAPEACDGTRVRKNPDIGQALMEEIGPCDFPYYSEVRDCALIPDDSAIKYGEYCPSSGQMQKNVGGCCLDGNYVDDTFLQTATRTCAPGLQCLLRFNADFFNNTVCSCGDNEKWNAETEVCEPITVVKAACGNGKIENGEQCDDGVKNVPSTVANKSWIDITQADITTLAASGCLDSCRLAQCSDKQDNDKKNGTDGDDAACRDGAFGNGSTTLIGYNVEQCPMCQLDEEKDEIVAFNTPVNTLVATITVRQHDLDPSDVENLDQAYCMSGKKTIQGTDCSCTGANEVCFAEHLTDDEGIIDGLGSCECKKLNPPPDMQTWTWACKTDKDCSQDYRCAYYSTYKYLIGSGGKDVDIFRCKKLIDDGDTVCRSRWDCKSRYKSTTTVNASGKLERDPTSRTKCIEINQGTAKCCNPDAKDPSKSCVRPNLKGSATGPIPNFAQCQTGGGARNIAGGDGGWDSGDGSGGGDGGDSGGRGNGSASSSSSASQCNIYNPCIALTSSLVRGQSAYTMPPACPLTGNKRTCYIRCIADINATGLPRDCDAQCSASESDLNMCACNPDIGDCTFSCVDDFSECNMLCAYDTNPTACRTQCRGEYRSCLNSCGRVCPASANSSAVSRRSTSSASTSTSKASDNSSNSSRSSGSSRSSSSGTSNGSNGSNNSNGSNGSQSSKSANSSTSHKSSQDSKGSSVSSKTSISSTSQTSSNRSISSSKSSDKSSQSSKSSKTSSSQSKSSGSNSSAVCADIGTVPEMRVLFSRVESTNPNVTLEQRVYIDGILPRMVGGQAETIAAGEWFPINSINTEDFASIYDGPNLVRNGADDPALASINFGISPASWVRGGIEKGTDNTYDTWYGTMEFRGATATDAYCSKGDYAWACPELERDGVVLAPDNDEVWVENGVVHFALHAKNVTNIDGRSDHFNTYYKLLPVCPDSSSSSNRSASSFSGQSKSSTSSNNSSMSSLSLRSSSFNSSYSTGSSQSNSSSLNGGIGGNDSGVGGNTGNTGIGGTNTGIGGNTGNIGNAGISGTGFGGTIGGTVTGIGGNIGGISGYTSSTGSCRTDQDCVTGTRCILNRCLTVTDIAQLPVFCGNARIDAGEQCDNGAGNSNNPNAYCRPDCTLGRCSDGIIDTPLEQCDDGNTVNNDGCSSSCQPERGAPTILPATTIELPFDYAQGVPPFTNKGDHISDIRYPSSVNGQLPSVPSTPDTGPAALAVMIAGGAAGWLYRRRK